VKIVRWVAAAALTLISLMDIGIALPGGGNSVPVRVLAPLLGAGGLVAVYGLLRRRHWGTPAALAAGAVNVASALIALAAGSDGASTGLAVSVIALLLTAASAYSGRTRPTHAQPADLSS
jgi:peptidoglycan/LPS O-acetylase OafA/YrhL